MVDRRCKDQDLHSEQKKVMYVQKNHIECDNPHNFTLILFKLYDKSKTSRKTCRAFVSQKIPNSFRHPNYGILVRAAGIDKLWLVEAVTKS